MTSLFKALVRLIRSLPLAHVFDAVVYVARLPPAPFPPPPHLADYQLFM